MQVHVDTVGAIFLAENNNSGERTKHVDIRYHFVREVIQEGKVKIVFVRSKENVADIFTKNTTGDIFQQHMQKLVWSKEQMNEQGAEGSSG